jgi:predicted Zn-ribbon and HTH transcriptional regulator
MGKRTEYQREYQRKYREKNKEKLNKYNLVRNLNKAEHLKEYRKNYYQTFKKYDRYGITREDYELLLESQKNKCKICDFEFNSENDIRIDHNHNNNQVRGLLCHSCNVALGHMRDDIQLLEKAINYLKGLQ